MVPGGACAGPGSKGLSARAGGVTTADGRTLPGLLHAPVGASGPVVFAHGSGSSRLSPRNVEVARVLNAGGLATLLFDLLTADEAADRTRACAILLGTRLVSAIRWARDRPELADLPLGSFGASTGSAGAPWAAAEVQEDVAAVVSRGGRPDLAATRLHAVLAPTLLIVGSRDPTVLYLNERARRRSQCPSDLAVVRGAIHLFEESGALEEVARLARAWFVRYLTTVPTAA